MTDIRIPGAPSLRYRLMLAVYGVLVVILLPLIWRYFQRRAKADPLYGEFPEERRGAGEAFEADVWVHAVSLGEMKSAVPLIRLFLNRGYRVVTTHTTPAGRRAAETAFADQIANKALAIRYAPIDRQDYWKSFFRSANPKIGLVMELEFWPGMIEAAARNQIPLCLANSQMPSRSFPRSRRLASWVGNPVARAAHIFAKSERMAARFRELRAKRVSVCGETRFDIGAPEAHVAAGEAFRRSLGDRSVVTFASVVAGEEAIYLNTVRELLESENPPFIIWVPRAPELFEDTVARLREAGLRVGARTECFDERLEQVESCEGIDVLVGDSLNEMFFYLTPADVVVVGGGFVEKGAHNVIEPLSQGKPVITGPHVWTIEFPAVEAEAAGVLEICAVGEELSEKVRFAMRRGSEAAQSFHRANQGASERIFEAVRPLLGEKH